MTGVLKTLADVEELTFDWVDWYNNRRLLEDLGLLATLGIAHLQRLEAVDQDGIALGSRSGDAGLPRTIRPLSSGG